MNRLLFALALVFTAAPARAGNQCHEVSEVVGERRCTAFGQFWSTEKMIPLVLSMGAWSSVVRPTGHAFNGTVHGPTGNTDYQASDFIRGPIQSYGVDFRFGGYFARYGYLAFDFGFAFGHAQGERYERDGFRISPGEGVNFFHARMGPVVGTRVPLGRMSLRFESLVGLQGLFLAAQLEGTGVKPYDGAGGAMLVIEPRMALDAWLTPDTTLTAWAGTNVLRPGDVSMGIALSAHLRAFDGAF